MNSNNENFIDISFVLTMLIFITFFPFVLKRSEKPKSVKIPEQNDTNEILIKMSLKDYTLLLNNICHYLRSNDLGRIYYLKELQTDYVILYTMRAGSSDKTSTNVINDVINCVKVSFSDLEPTDFAIVNGEYDIEQEISPPDRDPALSRSKFLNTFQEDLNRRNVWF